MNKMNNKFTKIDFSTWNRTTEFNFFDKAGCNFNFTTRLDITNLYRYAKENNLKIYLTLVATLVKAINQHQAFKYGYENNELGFYDVVHPAFYQLMDNHQTKTLFSEYNDDLFQMINDMEQIIIKYQNSLEYRPQLIPKNIIMISCIPWFESSSISFELQYGYNFLAPICVFGQYKKEGDKLFIPLSLYVNHKVIDGYHICELLNYYQTMINNI